MTKKDLNNWDDFELFKSTSNRGGVSLYESYKLLKYHFEKLPKSELMERGWISSKDDISSLTDLFKDIHSNEINTLYRKSDSANNYLSSMWLSKVKSYAQASFSSGQVSEFSGLSKKDLKEIAKLSSELKNINKLPDLLAKKGVVLIYCKSLPGMKVDGAVFKLSSGCPAIGMSLRYSRLDYFWFTLLHELAHVALHLDTLEQPIVDDLDLNADSEIEIAANRLAKQSFVERHMWRNCEPKYDKSSEAINKFAKKIGIHPSIVAGMLRREFGNYAAYSSIVNEHDVREIVLNGY